MGGDEGETEMLDRTKNHRMLGVRSLVPALCVLMLVARADAADQKVPKLILQITVDQLRGDMPWRYYDRLGDGGFRYLLEQGTVYNDAHHRHANTETIVGHATLATGADPAAHGMVANVWLDRETGELAYNIEDARYPLLPSRAEESKDVEIDPTQKLARTKGRSPAAILASTFSDELAVHFGGRSKIFGVSVKDRGAVSMAGHAGKAYWFSKETGDFITSTFYYKQYPDWVSEWNRRRLADSYQGKSWELMREQSTYVFGEHDDRPYETDFPGYGRTFPHPFGNADSKYFYTLLTVSPVGDELTSAFAMALIDHEELGRDDIPDYLSVSFSSTDYIGHIFGPSSLESEDNILRLDRTLTDLFRFVEEKIGLHNTLVVLSADHGAPEAPEYVAGLGMEARRLEPNALDTEPAIQRLKERFGIGKDLFQTYFHPYLYLNHDVIRSHGLDQAEVERAVAAELMKFDGVALAVSSSDLRSGRLPEAPMIQQIRRNYHPKRSGDIYVVQEPYWHLYDDESIRLTAIHGSPWRYDTYVPIVFAGCGVPAQRIYRRVETVDIAPTLATYIGAKPPSGSVGGLLAEVLAECGAE
ncbi:MAG: alkaline phosphatase family protein [Phycisphaerales bacterium]|nr:MAG: alkaline phosphatase family protein [Phycisphaerales bacterium]